MWEEIAKAVPIFFSSMLKFILGPSLGYLAGLNMVTTILVTVAGMMTVVLAFAFFGDLIRRKIINRYFGPRKRFTEQNRKFVVIWRKYGLAGVAALTPILFTPIGGVLLALSFGSPRDKLIIYMFVSASIWSVVLTLVVYLFGNSVLPDFMKP
ncbi:MAG TPA: hypothetical protein VFW11_00330 [Cyclobacteriaceae bacterium]|nr:hypothetical protein [Cyclobacteriaceae bacterium]